MWAQGDYAAVALLLEPCAVKLAQACAIPSPFEWGDPAIVKRRFDGLASEVEGRRVT